MEQATLSRVASSAERVRLDPQRASDHIDRLFRAAWALCGSREDAEDLVQETYARVLAKPRFLRSEDDLGYLLRTLRNTFLNQKRTQSRRLRTAPLPEELDVIADPRALRPGRRGRGRRGLCGRRPASRRLSRRARRGRRHRALLQGGGAGSADSRGDGHEPPLPRSATGRAAGRGWRRVTGGSAARTGPTRTFSPEDASFPSACSRVTVSICSSPAKPPPRA